MLQEESPAALSSIDALRGYLNPVLDFLYTARPTAVNLGTAIKRLRAILLAELDETTDVRGMVRKLVKEARLIADEDVGRNKEMSKNGAEWLVTRFAETPERLDGGKVNVYVPIGIYSLSQLIDTSKSLTVCNTGSLGKPYR
jgi:methylthioribose-1-phosphate isomerase